MKHFYWVIDGNSTVKDASKNGSNTEKAGLHLYTKYHDAVILRKKFTIDHQ
jgi:hypothetical protein